MATISDEKIIAALLECGSITAAAKAAKVSERTIYGRMQNAEFCRKYKTARENVLTTALAGMNKKISKAMETIMEIMNDPERSASARLQAAGMILDAAEKFTTRDCAAVDLRQTAEDEDGGIIFNIVPVTADNAEKVQAEIREKQ